MGWLETLTMFARIVFLSIAVGFGLRVGWRLLDDIQGAWDWALNGISRRRLRRRDRMAVGE